MKNNIDHLKPFKAVEQDGLLPSGVRAWQLQDCNGADYAGEYVSIEDAVKTSEFDLVIVCDLGSLKMVMQNKDFVYYASINGNVAMFRTDHAVVSNNYFAESALLDDLLVGNFLWLDDDGLAGFNEIFDWVDIDDVGDDKTFFTFIKAMTEHQEYKGVQVWASDAKLMKEARKKVDYLQITEGIKLRDFYKTEIGEVYAFGQSYNAYVPGEDYEETDLTIAQAMGFINKGGR